MQKRKRTDRKAAVAGETGGGLATGDMLGRLKRRDQTEAENGGCTGGAGVGVWKTKKTHRPMDGWPLTAFDVLGV